ncbi:GNAT family N-acetyltransferase [Inquilinus limosus]|uniref:GNAT family N-acetyltransferase n=1 Tax=Inquilinus limosus TaxID=171674 RepID=UPI003F14DACE
MAAFLTAHWGAPLMALHGRLIDLRDLPAIVTEPFGRGLATFDPEAGELMSLDADPPGQGVGTALVEAVAAELKVCGHRVMRVTTTNDNLDALRFYQRRGFRLVALRRGAIEAARRLKPSIPLVGAHGIPIRDEIDLERPL